MHEAIIISGLHLGSHSCQVKEIERFLAELPATKRLILNGDVLENTEHRLTKHHWRVLSLLRSKSDELELIWVRGNHDHDADAIGHLIGAVFVDEYQFGPVLVVHGDRWDKFISDHPLITNVADWFYQRLQGFNRSFAARAKSGSKEFQRLAGKVRTGAIEYARKLGATTVVCGHTHQHESVSGPVSYWNTGSWTDHDAYYLAVDSDSETLVKV